MILYFKEFVISDGGGGFGLIFVNLVDDFDFYRVGKVFLKVLDKMFFGGGMGFMLVFL